jgi:hypothetical protein
MGIKKKIRRCIAELMQLIYKRGYRDGARSVLIESESVATEDAAEDLGKEPAALEATAEVVPVETKPAKAKSRRKASKDKPAPKAAVKEERGKPKSVIVQEALQTLLTEKGEARRDEILAAAQAENPAITKHDLNNGLRALAKRSVYRVASDDSGRYLPA